MWNQKFIMSIISNFLNAGGSPVKNSVEVMRKAIHEEVTRIGYKFLFGLVLVAIIVMALFHFGNSFRIFLEHFDNGNDLEMIAFGLIAVVSGIGLYFLFNGTPSKGRRNAPAASSEPPPPVDLMGLAFVFFEGFMEGMQKKSPTETKQSEA